MMLVDVLPLSEARKAGFNMGKEHVGRMLDDAPVVAFNEAQMWYWARYMMVEGEADAMGEEYEAIIAKDPTEYPHTNAERLTIYVAFTRGFLDGINPIHV